MPEQDDVPEKNKAAAELGRRGGLKGGAVRAARMSPEERTESARKAAAARWARVAAQGGDAVTKARSPDGKPFVFTLNPEEVSKIIETAISGKGGLQDLQKKLRRQLEHGNFVTFDNAGLGQLIRYMTRYGEGSFETRLRNAFARSLMELLRPIFEGGR